jgi:hypothetical protein
MEQPLVLPVYAGDRIRSEICISCQTDSCLYLAARTHFAGVCGNAKHLLLRASVWIFDTSSRKRVIFPLAPPLLALCLSAVPFVALDADKWIAAHGNMRGHGKSNVYSSPWKPTMIIIFGKQGNEK